MKHTESIPQPSSVPVLPVVLIGILAAIGVGAIFFFSSDIAWTSAFNTPSQKDRTKQGMNHGSSASSLEDTSYDKPNSYASRYVVVDTNQQTCYGSSGKITCGQEYPGQDAEYQGVQPAYQDNGDGTVTDLNTGLMWQQDPGTKQTYNEAVVGVESFSLAGYDDWRIPSIKELYSLMDFSGVDPGPNSTEENSTPFLDDAYFAFAYGDESAGDRFIDSQWVTSTIYESTVMNNEQCFFGVNFADGRIKCYPSIGDKTYYAIYVRGESYGENAFVDNENGTIIDTATGLTWTQEDSGEDLLWDEALAYCEGLSLAGEENWRLPNIKELQSIVDYTRSPDTTSSPALNPIFSSTQITNEAGDVDYGFYWSSTTHVGSPNRTGNAAYISFGRALGNMTEFGGWVDVHGAGAQRSDPKFGVPEGQEEGFGPQGDARRAYNLVRCVSGGPVVATDIDVSAAPANTQNQEEKPQRIDTQPARQPQQDKNPDETQSLPLAPQEAVAACRTKRERESCTIRVSQGNVQGICKPIAGQLACMPEE